MNAFQITEDDIATVLKQAGLVVSIADSGEWLVNESRTKMRELMQIIEKQCFRIENAALCGDDMETQTNYAHQEIADILKELGAIVC